MKAVTHFAMPIVGIVAKR